MSQFSGAEVKKIVVNGLIVVLVFGFAFFVATQALMHKINNYELNKSLLFLTVKKEQVQVSTTVSGRVEELLVRPGDHVDEGQVVARLRDEGREFKIEALRDVASENLSARTELELLLSQTDEYSVRAPRAGVVERLAVTKGTTVIGGGTIITLFADDNIQLVGNIRPDQYNLIDKHRSVTIFSQRLGQAFTASFQGITEVRDDLLPDGTIAPQVAGTPTTPQIEMYEVLFALNEQEESNSFIQGERIEILSENVKIEQLKPIYRLARIWNSLILGTDFDALRKYNEQTPVTPQSE